MNCTAVLDDLIESLPDIYGGFICSADHGIIASKIKVIATDRDALRIFSKVEKLSTQAAKFYTSISKIEFRFGATILRAYPINRHHWLFLTHATQISPARVKMVVAMAMNSLKEVCTNGTSAVDPIQHPEKIEKVAKSEPTTVQRSDIEKLLRADTGLQEAILTINKAMYKVVGPIGEIMVEEALLAWSRVETPSQQSLSNFFHF